MTGHSPWIIAHRGASAFCPENTLEAFRAGIHEHKADGLEFDVQLTADDVPVILHDSTLDRTTNGKGPLASLSYREIQGLDAGHWFDPDKTGRYPWRGRQLRIPKLEDLLAGFPKIPLSIELKQPSEKLVHEVMALLRKYGSEQNAIVGSKYHVVSRTMRRSYPASPRFCSEVDVLRLLGEKVWRKNPSPDALAVASCPIKANIFSFDTKEWIDFLHKKAMRAFFWTINDPEKMKDLAEKGADAIITNDPALARKTLGRLPETGSKGV